MKKVFRVFCVLLLSILCVSALMPAVNAGNSEMPTRVINVVYDDSGSMIKTNGALVDTWCQAKYAMEVFAAMLGEKDTMNVYCMNKFEATTSGAPELTLNGGDGSSINVQKVHNMLTRAGNTPFNSVIAAYESLKKVTADEKWLVVLTDGEFQPESTDVNGYFNAKDPSVKVMFLGMGPDAQGIKADESKNIFFEKAQNNKEILNKITGICTRIFNSNRLEVNASTKVCSFDIPMGELTVFAQGANVTINGIKAEDGTVYKSSSNPVVVKYSEKATSNPNYPEPLIDKSLLGCIAVFKEDFAAGAYTIDVSGAETIEVFYKPNIEISALLKNGEGEEVNDLSDLEAGDYVIEFFFVKGGTNERVPVSKLLGDVQYEATVVNNGKKLDKSYSSGDTISIEEGGLDIDVIARYLKYNSVSTHLGFSIFKNKGINAEIAANPTYEIATDSIVNGDTPTQIKLLLDSREFTAEEWAQFELPEFNVETGGNKGMKDLRFEKSEQPGIINIFPSLKDGKTTPGTYKELNISASYSQQIGAETWSGDINAVVPITDTRSWMEQNIDKIIKAAVAGAILLILLGYTPLFKKRLPKNLKSGPRIEFEPKDFMQESSVKRGSVKKNLPSTILPFCAQRGTLRYTPSGVAAPFKLKARSGRRMEITNLMAFKSKENIFINANPISEIKKHKDFSGGIEITTEITEGKYICNPNIKF